MFSTINSNIKYINPSNQQQTQPSDGNNTVVFMDLIDGNTDPQMPAEIIITKNTIFNTKIITPPPPNPYTVTYYYIISGQNIGTYEYRFVRFTFNISSQPCIIILNDFDQQIIHLNGGDIVTCTYLLCGQYNKLYKISETRRTQ